MKFDNLLIEIGTEELPPKSLRKLAESLLANFEEQLHKAELNFESSHWYATPRRLTVYIKKLMLYQTDKVIEKRGPAVTQAFDTNGDPTKAAIGWARSNGITVDQAKRLKTDKGEWLLHQAKVTGIETKQLIPAMVQKALDKLPIGKPMRWGNNKTPFIRPVHTITMLLGNEVIEGELFGIQSARTIRGHRFMGKASFELDHADNYLETLKEQGKVLADYEARKNIIAKRIKDTAANIGGKIDNDNDLIEEVTSLVEWPVILTANFERNYLKVPAEALVYTMKSDQKYFPVFDDKGQLLPHFIFVTNIESSNPQQIISGNEKVIRPRLADAEFFFKTDQNVSLDNHLSQLKKVVFEKQLGSLSDRVERISAMAGFIATAIDTDVTDAMRAGLLSKADLMTNMVMEFTDTQGIMGMHYARLDGEKEAVAIALKEQYQPKFSGDKVPTAGVSVAVAIAEKIDTLVGLFGIGKPPKGAADPFALRRAAIGILRICVENNLPLDLVDLITKSHQLYGDILTNTDCDKQVLEFIMARFRAWYQDQNISVDVILAVLARHPTSPADFDSRIKAVTHFRTLTQAAALAAANKRVANILAKVDKAPLTSINDQLLQEPAEQALADKLKVLQPQLAPLFAQTNYQQALIILTTISQSIDSFFEEVMVMVDDKPLRDNRLALLNNLRTQFLHIADISLLQ